MGCHPDSGKCIRAHSDRLYTRQTTGPELVNIYPLQDQVVLPKLRNHWIHWDKPLLESFALVGDEVVFCESCECPNLVIFPTRAEGEARELAVDFGVGIQQPVYVGAGPSNSGGHVMLICGEWMEIHQKNVVLRLVSLGDGSTVWRHTLDIACDLKVMPDPVTYHNGYIYLHIRTHSMKVLDASTGRHRSFT